MNGCRTWKVGMRAAECIGWCVVFVSLVGCNGSHPLTSSPDVEGRTAEGKAADSGSGEEGRVQQGPRPQAFAGDRVVREIAARDWLNTSSPVSLESLKGKVVMLEFWATWCGPCIQGIPHLNELQETYAADGFRIVSLTDEDRSTVLRFQERRQLEMNYIIGLESSTGQAYGVTGIPHAILIDRDGKMAWRGHPMNPECEEQIKLALAQ